MKPFITTIQRTGVLILTLALGQFVNASTLTNFFNADPGWTGVGNASGGSSYGFSAATSHAGGAAGEVGGTFARSTAENYYADTFLNGHGFSAGGNATLAFALSASGKFDVRNTANMNSLVQIGHRSAGTSDRSFLGLAIQELSASSFRIRAGVSLANGTDYFSSSATVATDGDYWFSYSYDPTGGVNAQGRLALTVTNSVGTHSFLIDLTAADRAVGGILDAFGMGGYPHDFASASITGDVFLDDVIYTAIPEPAALALLALGGMMVAWRRVRRK